MRTRQTYEHIDRRFADTITRVLLSVFQSNTSQTTGHVHDYLPLATFDIWKVGLCDADGAADVDG